MFLVQEVHARERERATLSHARGYFRVSRLSLYGLRKRRLLVESRYCQVTVTCETGLHVPIFHRVQKGLPLFLLFRFCLQLCVDEFYSCLGQTNGDKRLILKQAPKQSGRSPMSKILSRSPVLILYNRRKLSSLQHTRDSSSKNLHLTISFWSLRKTCNVSPVSA